MEEDPFKMTRRAAFRLLSARSYHSRELRKKLGLKGFSPEAIEKAIEECRRLGFLNDEAYAEALSDRLQKRGYGPRYISAKLKSKGIHAPSSEADQEAQIRSLMEGRLKNREKHKAIAALQRRGFDLESIFKVICNN